MKILHVIGSLAPRYGGPSTACPALCRALAAAGHTVAIYTTNSDGGRAMDVPLGVPEIRDGVETHVFPAWRSPRELKISPALLAALRRDVKDWDAVHIYSFYGFWVWAAARACRDQNIPYVLHPHGSLGAFLSRRHRIRKWIYARAVGARIWQGAARILFNSSEEMRETMEAVRGFQPRGSAPRAAVVPVGVEDEWFEEPDAESAMRVEGMLAGLTGRRLIVFLGRIDFKKGLDLLVRAFARVAHAHDDAHLVLAGPESPGYDAKVRRWLREAGVQDRATLTGRLAGAERVALVRKARMLVLTSYSENFGQVVAESMAAGTPVVISDQVNIAPDVELAGAGLIVRCDEDPAAAAMEALLASPGRAREMGARGRDWAARNWRWPSVAARMLEVYRGVAQSPRIPLRRSETSDGFEPRARHHYQPH